MRHAVIHPADVEWADESSSVDGGPGLSRQVLVDHGTGSVHMTLGWARLAAGGETSLHVHSYEEAFYVTSGSVDVQCGGTSYRLSPDDYGVVPIGTPHAFRSPDGATWLEVTAPQVRDAPADTFAIGPASWPPQVEPPDFASPLRGPVGHFAESQLPPASQLQMEGYSGGDVTGIRLKMLIDKVFGSQHLNLFVVEFEPGGAGNSHDHPFEEAYVFLSGSADALLDGERYVVETGDVCWAGVGGVHAYFTRGEQPVRWIEVQMPQPPAQNAFRFAAQWHHVADVLG